MPTFRNLSIQWKLLWVSMLASGTTLLLICTAFVFYDRMTFQEAMVRQLAGQADIVGFNSASPLLFDDPDTAWKRSQRSAPNRASSLLGFTVPMGSGSPSMTATRPQGLRYYPHGSGASTDGTVLRASIWCSSDPLSVVGKRLAPSISWQICMRYSSGSPAI